MKLSVSLPADDVAFLDELAKRRGASSRSSVLHDAVRLLRRSAIEADYAAAWDEWDASGDREAWEQAGLDGWADAPR